MTRGSSLYCIGVLGLVGCVAPCYADDVRPALHRNPFEKPRLEQRTGSAGPPEGAALVAPAWELRATLTAGRSSLADVDGVIIRLGDEIDGYRLLSVSEGSAVFDRNGSKLVLTVDDEEAEGSHE